MEQQQTIEKKSVQKILLEHDAYSRELEVDLLKYFKYLVEEMLEKYA